MEEHQGTNVSAKTFFSDSGGWIQGQGFKLELKGASESESLSSSRRLIKPYFLVFKAASHELTLSDPPLSTIWIVFPMQPSLQRYERLSLPILTLIYYQLYLFGITLFYSLS